MTGDTVVSYTTFPSVSYPVYQLIPVQSDGVTLFAKLKSIFA
jgi:hypothetical protein